MVHYISTNFKTSKKIPAKYHIRINIRFFFEIYLGVFRKIPNYDGFQMLHQLFFLFSNFVILEAIGSIPELVFSCQATDSTP